MRYNVVNNTGQRGITSGLFSELNWWFTESLLEIF
jgi:hypothetical protein